MEEKKRKKGHFRKKAVFLAIGLLLGALLGFALIAATDHFLPLDGPLYLIGGLFLLLFWYFIEVVCHEAGHLVMGLLTGYGFSSFRVMSLMLVKADGRFTFRRFSIPGTLGQCLLVPPERDGSGNYPYVLYNLGGIIVNLIFALVGSAIMFFTDITGWAGLSCAYVSGIGLLMAIENALPLNSLGVTNDGSNIRSLMRNEVTRDALWKQLYVNAKQSEGVALSDMPGYIFDMPDEKYMDDVLISASAVLLENLYMEEMRMDEALELIHRLRTGDGIRLAEVYDMLLRTDEVTLELLKGFEVKDIPGSVRKTLKNYVMFPSVLRSSYAVALLFDRDEKAAEKIRKQFDRVLSKYPFPMDRVTEPKYIALIDEAWRTRIKEGSSRPDD